MLTSSGFSGVSTIRRARQLPSELASHLGNVGLLSQHHLGYDATARVARLQATFWSCLPDVLPRCGSAVSKGCRCRGTSRPLLLHQFPVDRGAIDGIEKVSFI